MGWAIRKKNSSINNKKNKKNNKNNRKSTKKLKNSKKIRLIDNDNNVPSQNVQSPSNHQRSKSTPFGPEGSGLDFDELRPKTNSLALLQKRPNSPNTPQSDSRPH